jgi:Protein of unknown function (DUF4079)/Na+-dependent bicarbonate transporter superfamily/Eukaryotic cytochrome b561
MKDLLAYVHPVVQGLVLLMAVATLRLGLALKNHRTGQRPLAQWEGIYNRHTQLGLICVSCLIGGYVLGILSMPWFRERPPFRSPHFFFGTLALLLFVAGGYTGWRLKQGTERYADVRDIHGFLVYFALFIALAVAIMGFILLP